MNTLHEPLAGGNDERCRYTTKGKAYTRAFLNGAPALSPDVTPKHTIVFTRSVDGIPSAKIYIDGKQATSANGYRFDIFRFGFVDLEDLAATFRGIQRFNNESRYTSLVSYDIRENVAKVTTAHRRTAKNDQEYKEPLQDRPLGKNEPVEVLIFDIEAAKNEGEFSAPLPGVRDGGRPYVPGDDFPLNDRGFAERFCRAALPPLFRDADLLIYATGSYGPRKPRFRVLVILDTPATPWRFKEYCAGYTHAAGGWLDISSFNPGQFQFISTIFFENGRRVADPHAAVRFFVAKGNGPAVIPDDVLTSGDAAEAGNGLRSISKGRKVREVKGKAAEGEEIRTVSHSLADRFDDAVKAIGDELHFSTLYAIRLGLAEYFPDPASVAARSIEIEQAIKERYLEIRREIEPGRWQGRFNDIDRMLADETRMRIRAVEDRPEKDSPKPLPSLTADEAYQVIADTLAARLPALATLAKHKARLRKAAPWWRDRHPEMFVSPPVPPPLLVKTTVGTGKTRAAIAAVRRLCEEVPSARVAHFVPYRRLAEEARKRYLAEGYEEREVMVYQGVDVACLLKDTVGASLARVRGAKAGNKPVCDHCPMKCADASRDEHPEPCSYPNTDYSKARVVIFPTFSMLRLLPPANVRRNSAGSKQSNGRPFEFGISALDVDILAENEAISQADAAMGMAFGDYHDNPLRHTTFDLLVLDEFDYRSLMFSTNTEADNEGDTSIRFNVITKNELKRAKDFKPPSKKNGDTREHDRLTFVEVISRLERYIDEAEPGLAGDQGFARLIPQGFAEVCDRMTDRTVFEEYAGVYYGRKLSKEVGRKYRQNQLLDKLREFAECVLERGSARINVDGDDLVYQYGGRARIAADWMHTPTLILNATGSQRIFAKWWQDLTLIEAYAKDADNVKTYFMHGPASYSALRRMYKNSVLLGPTEKDTDDEETKTGRSRRRALEAFVKTELKAKREDIFAEASEWKPLRYGWIVPKFLRDALVSFGVSEEAIMTFGSVDGRDDFAGSDRLCIVSRLLAPWGVIEWQGECVFSNGVDPDFARSGVDGFAKRQFPVHVRRADGSLGWMMADRYTHSNPDIQELIDVEVEGAIEQARGRARTVRPLVDEDGNAVAREVILMTGIGLPRVVFEEAPYCDLDDFDPATAIGALIEHGTAHGFRLERPAVRGRGQPPSPFALAATEAGQRSALLSNIDKFWVRRHSTRMVQGRRYRDWVMAPAQRAA